MGETPYAVHAKSSISRDTMKRDTKRASIILNFTNRQIVKLTGRLTVVRSLLKNKPEKTYVS